MVSPDVTPYVDLRVLDRDAQDVFEAALTNLLTYLPEWVPREGQTEVLLLESLALEVEESIFAVNRVPGAVVEVLLRLYGIDRDLGAPPVTTLQFTATNSAGYTIPAGTRVVLQLSGGDGEDVVVFATDVPLVIPAGSTTGTVTATGDRSTSAANGTVVGAPVQLLDSVSAVEAVTLFATVSAGRDEELDEDWFARGVQRFSRLAETLVLPAHFTAAALEHPEVARATTIDNFNAAAGTGAPGDHPGHVTVVVYGESAVVDPAVVTAMQTDFDARAQANLAVHMADPTLTAVDVAATVVAAVGYPSATVQANCAAALADYLSPTTWEWGTTVYVNELIALLDRVEGVERVTSITTPATDEALTGVAPLVTPGTFTITVT